MPDQSPPSIDLPSTNPMVAYAADLERLGRPTIGALDDLWLTLAHALYRLSGMTAEERRSNMPRTADSIAAGALALGLPATAPLLRVATALRALYDDAVVPGDDVDAPSEMVFAVQSAVDEIEIAGGFSLAYATLVNLDTALHAYVSPRVRGNLGAQQGRAMRQLGRAEHAKAIYTAVLEQGYDCDARDVVTRGLLGLALLAATRGNYPEARDLYERALATAQGAEDNDLLRSAHHGLMNCGFASGDLDAAMVHGWNVLRLCIHPDARAEALLNMGEVCRQAGELDVALRVFFVAKTWTSIPRVRLHATASALLTAASLPQPDTARQLLQELTALLPQIGDRYAVTGSRLELAESLHLLGDRPEARAQLAVAYADALAAQYHELSYQAEQLQCRWDAIEAAEAEAARTATPAVTPPAPRRVRHSEDYKVVLRSLRNLTATAR